MNANDNQGCTPLHVAVLMEEYVVFSDCVLKLIVISFSMEVFDYLLQQPNINLNNRNYFGETPLLKSLQCSSETFAIKLIEAGADVSIPNLQNETPLHEAVKKYKNVTQLLIEKGADINALDFDSYSALHEAVCHADYEMVAMLLYYDADATSLNSHGLTPFMMAVNNNVDPEIQRLLLEYETDFNRVADDDYSTLLLALNSKSPLIRDIVERGADVNYALTEINALQLSLHLEDIVVFKMIWAKFDYGTVYSSGYIPLLHTFQVTHLSSDVWLECLSIVFYSDVGGDVINDYVRNDPENYFSCLVDMFHRQSLSEKELHPFVCVSLSFGAEVYLSNAELLYQYYGYNETLKLFLHVGVKINKTAYPTLPRFIVDVQSDPASLLGSYRLHRNISYMPDQVRNINSLLNFFTPTLRFRQQLQSCCDFETSLVDFFEFKFTASDEYVAVCDRLKGFSVPSLKELSRDVARSFVCTAFDVSNCVQFYSLVRHLELPKVIKQIISYEMPVNR